ncbi:RHS repeat protein [Ramlibacter albus]|uniref:RHS repeat protein n=1 Tax=Ramlibacter albus TaxID=2079448 RepID=A0A923S4K6_9BURK|nr:RHS repeat protein [Ramlibacter albus]MBC5767018.1 RHS repeat protein [Ramlibacter albus]
MRPQGMPVRAVCCAVLASITTTATLAQGVPSGPATQFLYDANGRLIGQTDPLNQGTRMTLDALGRPTAITFADNSTAAQSWSPLDQLVQVTDPKGVATRYTRNAFGEVTSQSSPDTGTVTFKRDANGRVIEARDAKAQVTRIERDALGRPTRIRHDAGSTTNFSYDPGGQVDRLEDSSGSISYTRDLHGRVLSATWRINDNPANPSAFAVNYGYTLGDLTGIIYPSGLKVTYRRVAGRVTGVDVLEPGRNKPWAPFVSSVAHTPLGQPKAWTWSNGDAASRSFDTSGRMTSTEFARYTYDAASRIVGITQDLWASRTVVSGTATVSEVYRVPVSWTAAYDNRNRLIRLEREGAKSVYSYDANSNRLQALEMQGSDVDLEGSFEQPGMAQGVQVALKVDAGSNRLLGFSQTLTRMQAGQAVRTSVTNVAYEVDANGAMTSDGLRHFVYGDDNRLARVEIVKDGEAAAVRYLHNGWGQRVFKSEPQALQTLPKESELGNAFVNWLRKNFGWMLSNPGAGKASLGQAFIYGDGEIPRWALLGEYDNGSSAGKGTTEIIWLPVAGGGAIPIGLYRNGKLYAVHTDLAPEKRIPC